jgi:hypothetical protein
MDRFNNMIAPFSMDRIAQGAINAGNAVGGAIAPVAQAAGNGLGRFGNALGLGKKKNAMAQKMQPPTLAPVAKPASTNPADNAMFKAFGGPLLNSFAQQQQRMSQY